jgi:competence protein ComEC
VAALVLSWARPGSVLDLSFQLSFVSVASIAVGMQRLQRRLPACGRGAGRGRLHRGVVLVAAAVGTSLCATVGTAPLTAFHFNQVSLAGLVANVVAVPVFSAAVIAVLGGAFLVLCGVDVPAAGCLRLAGVLIDAGTAFVSTVAGVPGAALRVVTPTPIELAIAYAALGCVLAPRGRWRRLVTVGVALAALIDAGYWVRSRYFRPELRVTFLDVGQGDAAVVEFPGSAVVVIDGGGFPGSDFDVGARVVAPFLWQRKVARLDAVAMSHGDADHAGGLAYLVAEFAPREFWWNGRAEAGAAVARVRDALQRAGVVERRLSRSTPPWRIGPVDVRPLHPVAAAAEGEPRGSANDASLVLRLGWGNAAVLFTGDIEARGEAELVARGDEQLHSTVLKVPHHGSRTSSSERLLDAVRPAVGVVSLGFLNRYGFPHPEVLRRYGDRGVCVLRTDAAGAVVVHVRPDGLRTEPACDAGDGGGRG